VQADGRTIRRIESGQGNSVVVIEGPGETALSALASLLAQEFHVIALALPAPNPQRASAESVSTREMARTLDVRAVAAAGLEHYVLVAGSANAPDCPMASDRGAGAGRSAGTNRAQGLVAQGRGAANGAEHDGELERRLDEIRAPTLVLFGTNEEMVPPRDSASLRPGNPDARTWCWCTTPERLSRPSALKRCSVHCAISSSGAEKFVVSSASTAINP